MIDNLQLLRNTEMYCTCHYFKSRIFFLAWSNLLKYEQSTDQSFISRFFWKGTILFIIFLKGAVSISHTLLHVKSKVIYPKYSKYWLSTVALTIDCVCSKIWNHGLNHGFLFSLFKFFWVKKYSKLTWKFRIKIYIPILFYISVFIFFVCPNGFGEQLFSNVYSTWDV